jgi:hypothetical protein
MKKIWEWLNGKKTVIGTLLIAASFVIPEPYDKVAYTLGGLIGGTGLAHKAQKYKNEAQKRKAGQA